MRAGAAAGAGRGPSDNHGVNRTQETRLPLRKRVPRAWPAFALLGVSGALLIAGLTTPVMRVRTLVFWRDDYSIVSGAVALAREGDAALAALLLVFSVCLPAAKLCAAAWLWCAPLAPARAARVASLLDGLGRWSMADVLVVSLVVLVSKSSSLMKAEPREGLYLYAAGAVGSMAAVGWTVRALRKWGGTT